MKKLLAMLMVMAMIFSLAAVGTAYADDADDFHIDSSPKPSPSGPKATSP